jgi:hypothetical protein
VPPIPPLPGAPERRPFRILKQRSGWFVTYLLMPFLHCSSKKEAKKIAVTMNRLITLLERYPDDDPDTLLMGLYQEIYGELP